jgi:RimJ/RimL family protein N-acetyltransferase
MSVVVVTTFMETERLLLRRLAPTDADDLFALDADPEVRRYLDAPRAPTRKEVDAALGRMLAAARPGRGFFAAIEMETGDFVGWFHFRSDTESPDVVDLGYKLRRASWGRGYATEGARALVDRGFEEGSVRRVVATALTANAASRRVMEKCGLRLVGHFRHNGHPAVRYAREAP